LVIDTFNPPPEARAAATTVVRASLAQRTAEVRTALYAANRDGPLGPVIHATLNLYRALASRLLTPGAMPFVDGGLAEIADDDPDPDRLHAAGLLFAHAQLSPTLPSEDVDLLMHNTGAEQFNAALDEAEKHGRRFAPIFLAALELWSDLLNGQGAEVLNDVAAELWPDE
jgi:hypothetical protein